MLGSTLAVLQDRMVDALNKEALKSYAKCLLCLSASSFLSRNVLSAECFSLGSQEIPLLKAETPVWAFEPSDVKSLMILLSHWMVKTNLALVETSKQRAGWGGRADPSASSKSRSWESPAALGMLTVMLKAFHAQPQEGCWNSKGGRWIVTVTCGLSVTLQTTMDLFKIS